MNFDRMKDTLVGAANRAGLKEYEIYAMSVKNTSTETLKQEISSFSSGTGGGISFRCIVNGKMGYASTELLTEAEMEALVDRAMDNAANIENEDEVFIYSGSESYEPKNAPEAELPDAATMKKWALDLQKATYACHPSVADGTQSGAMAYEAETMLCNSHGLELHNHVATAGVYVEAVVKEGEEAEYGVSIANVSGSDPAELSTLPARAVNEAREKLNAGAVASGKTDCVISAKQMRALLATFSSIFSAKMVQHGLSLLGGKTGEKIAADCVTITDDPRYPACPIQTSFDGEGVATYRKNVIEGGTLKTLLYDLTTAKKDGVTSTGNGQRDSYAAPVGISPYCFYLKAGDKTPDQLFGMVGDGLYITELKGMHAGANAVTGDFSLESAGFVIRDGKRAEAVKTFTIAGNFYELLKSIEALSDTVDFGFFGGFTNFGAPAVLLRGVSVAGK